MRKSSLLVFAVTALVAGSSLAADPSLTIGRQIDGQMSKSSRISDSGGRSQDYTLRLAANQLVAISAKSKDFDPVLILFGSDGSQVAENDDRGDGDTNALIVTSVQEAGDYIVRVNTLAGESGEALGAYTLKATVIADD